MSSTEIVHGNNAAPPTGYSPAGQKDDPMRYAVHTQQSHAASIGGVNPSASATVSTSVSATPGVEDKRFTTSYGMVVWPTLPGLSSSPSPTPAALGGTPTKPESLGLVHLHSSSTAAAAGAAARRAAQTMLPGTTPEQRNGGAGGGPLVS